MEIMSKHTASTLNATTTTAKPVIHLYKFSVESRSRKATFEGKLSDVSYRLK